MKTCINKLSISSVKQAFVIAASTIALAACDSGSSSNGSSENVLQGQFIDSAVAGLFYQTDSLSGLTDSDGTFQYKAGETVTFYLGDTELGRASGKDLLTPFDLTGHKALNTEVEIINALSTSSTPNSYDRAINIASLLQSLDINGDPEDGIDLGNAHEALKGLTITLYDKAVNFSSGTTMLEALSRAGINQTRSLTNTIKHLYSSLDIDVASSKTARQSNIFGANSQLDWRFTYNENGSVDAIEIDANGDGVPDGEKRFSYDAAGNVIGIVDSFSNLNETLSYDEANQLTERLSSDVSGNSNRETFSYTDTGKISRFDHDLENNGSTDRSSTFSYDESGMLSSIASDQDGDDVADTIAQYSYIGAKVSEYLEDQDADGESDLSISYRYDTKGNIVGQNTRSSKEGIAYSSSRFEYDANNNPILYERDDNQDGTPEYIEAYRYNKANQRIQYQRDLNADGKWDFTAQYFYDINGNRIRMIEDNDGNGIVDKVWESGYEAAVLSDTLERIIEIL